MASLSDHYRAAEEHLDAADDSRFDQLERLVSAITGAGHAILATAQPTIIPSPIDIGGGKHG